jgi:glycerol uptake facilitator-like aquaporin
VESIEDFGYGWIPVAGPIIGGIIGADVDKAFSTLPPLS